MKKVKSEYIFFVQANNDKDYPDDVRIEVNEEYKQQIKLTVYQERRRTKEEFIKLYKGIIKELDNIPSHQ